jgi:uncharacterized RDD family membrane protein YckC
MSEHELSAIPRQARPFQGHHAGVVTRAVAAAIDTVLVVVVLLAAYAVVAGVLFLLDPRHFHMPDLRLVTSLVVGAVVLGCYLTTAWALSGRTYGDLLMGLRVVTVRGDDVGWVRAAGRAAAYLALPIGLFWAVVDPGCRSLQDLVLRTVVVYDWQPHGNGRPLVVDTDA